MKLSQLLAGTVAALAAVAMAAPANGQARARAPFTIAIDGSSTVFPISEAVAEAFQQQNQGRVRVTVGESGTGGGFRKFCRGETHISDASRPISRSEMSTCLAAGISYIEVPIAFDGLTVVVHPSNPVRSVTVAQLRRIWEPAAQGAIRNWNQVNPAWPDLALSLYGPGTASGTFDYFTEAVNGKSKASRTDYTPSEDDNVIVQGVATNPGAMGYFGLAYYEQNQSRLRALAIDNGRGPVEPNAANVANGTYAPLSRPIFIYINAAALARPQVMQFAQFYVTNAARYSQQVGYIPLPASAYTSYGQRVQARQAGTAFGGQNDVGATIQEVLGRRLTAGTIAR